MNELPAPLEPEAAASPELLEDALVVLYSAAMCVTAAAWLVVLLGLFEFRDGGVGLGILVVVSVGHGVFYGSTFGGWLALAMVAAAEFRVDGHPLGVVALYEEVGNLDFVLMGITISYIGSQLRYATLAYGSGGATISLAARARRLWRRVTEGDGRNILEADADFLIFEFGLLLAGMIAWPSVALWAWAMNPADPNDALALHVPIGAYAVAMALALFGVAAGLGRAAVLYVCRRMRSPEEAVLEINDLVWDELRIDLDRAQKPPRRRRST